jgi:Na+-transporting NADH:ubiquinone oxidoreductase subunit A
MSKVIKIKRGLDIKLTGKPENDIIEVGLSNLYALKPTDFEGLTPKIIVNEGDRVKAGSPLFCDKYKPEIVFTSPVSGSISEIVRGERRKVLEILVQADAQIEYEDFGIIKPLESVRNKIIDEILISGLWPVIMQRPFAIIANPQNTPRSIFISGFDSAPLAPDYEYILKDQFDDFQSGVDALTRLTDGKVYLSLHTIKNNGGLFRKTRNVEIIEFSGPHPSGCIGVQINKIGPINKGEIVWYINPQDVTLIGRLFNKGIYDMRKTIALTGSEVKNPHYCKIINGCSVQSILGNSITDSTCRIISGNILSGEKIQLSGYIGFSHSQITVIPEDNKPEFFGWGLPGLDKYSASRTFFSWLKPKKEFRLNTKMYGGLRPFVVTGEFEKVFPMDIYPMQLLKAIIAQDIEQMEQLGIYEVAEEDFALCEFVDVSKIEIQKLVRQGLNLMIKEFN